MSTLEINQVLGCVKCKSNVAILLSDGTLNCAGCRMVLKPTDPISPPDPLKPGGWSDD